MVQGFKIVNINEGPDPLDQSPTIPISSVPLKDAVNNWTSNQIIGENTPSDSDTALSSARSLSSSTNTHGFVHEDTITSTTTNRGHNSFDSMPIINGTQDTDHIAGFQARPDYQSTGTIDRLTGFQSLVKQNGGTCTSCRHFEVRDASGTGNITTQYGFDVREVLTKGTTNYAFHSQIGENGSRFGGQVEVDSNDNYLGQIFVTSQYGASAPKWRMRRAKGTFDTPSEVVNNDGLLNLESYGYINGDFRRFSLYQVTVDGTPSASSYPTETRFGSVVSGSTAISNRMLFRGNGNVTFLDNNVEFDETSSAPSGEANKAILFCEDNGSGKTRLMVQFGTGAAQQLAIEP